MQRSRGCFSGRLCGCYVALLAITHIFKLLYITRTGKQINKWYVTRSPHMLLRKSVVAYRSSLPLFLHCDLKQQHHLLW